MRTYINQDRYLTEFNVHRKYAQSDLLLDLVWTHCNITAEIAYHLLLKNNLDQTQYNPGVVVQAALLYDVGIYLVDGFEWLSGQPPNGKPYIQHTVTGAWILRQEGFCEDVIRSAHSHSGVGITPKDIHEYGLALPEADYLPTTPVQELIMYASKFHSKAPRFKNVEEIKRSLLHFGEAKEDVFDELMDKYGMPDLEGIASKYKEWHKNFKYTTSQLTNTISPNLNSAGMFGA